MSGSVCYGDVMVMVAVTDISEIVADGGMYSDGGCRHYCAYSGGVYGGGGDTGK